MDDYLSRLLEAQQPPEPEEREGFSLKEPVTPAAIREKTAREQTQEEVAAGTEAAPAKGQREAPAAGRREAMAEEEPEKSNVGSSSENTATVFRRFLREMEPVAALRPYASEQKSEGAGQRSGMGRYAGFFGTETTVIDRTRTPEALSMFFQRDARRYS